MFTAAFQRLLHVDDALVAAAPEEEVFIAQCLYEGAVYQYIDLAEKFQLFFRQNLKRP